MGQKRSKDVSLDAPRKGCNIPGCKNLARRDRINSPLGGFYYRDLPQCAKHNADGSLHPSHTKRSKLKHALKFNFGMSLEEYEAKYESQGGRCAVCGRHESEFSRRLGVDHNHKTGELRALLCNHCNYLVGVVESESDLLQKARLYLAKLFY